MMQNMIFVVLLKGEKMDDVISRQQAIDALDKRFDNIPIEQTTEILQLRRDLRYLPSAEPKIIHCEDCKYGMLDLSFPHQWFCKFKGDEWNNGDYFCGHARKREVTE